MCIQGGCVILHRTRIRDYSGSTVQWVLEGKMTGVVIEKSPRFVMKTHRPRSCATVSPWGVLVPVYPPSLDRSAIPAVHLSLQLARARHSSGLEGRGSEEPATSSPTASHHSPHA
ncbi:hypothetical protein K525DRAFT_286335 [Schizophyllum commune Loenen D]|nr:hypothetical protein K525DRAFT_286335 [Schizophyllum commune Loenen D]